MDYKSSFTIKNEPPTDVNNVMGMSNNNINTQSYIDHEVGDLVASKENNKGKFNWRGFKVVIGLVSLLSAYFGLVYIISRRK